MNRKNIALFERHEGVRFVLGKSLAIYNHLINIHTANEYKEIKVLLIGEEIDLLITELCKSNPDGMNLSIFARQTHPLMKIIWITAVGCTYFSEIKKELGNIICLEKPLEIAQFRVDVLQALSLAA